MDSPIPVEVELMYEVMPCIALRCSQDPVNAPHPCSYFRKWGTYHSYDYMQDGAPANRDIQQPSEYMGKSYLLPEVLSGCRKAPILCLGINPNLAGFWEGKRNSLYPLFDEFKQYAHYFRYRNVAKLALPEKEYELYGGGKNDTPFINTDLKVPLNASGLKQIDTELQNQEMYLAYQDLLDSLAKGMKWKSHKLSVGDDISYGNMVACASAKWITKSDPAHPDMPPMTTNEKDGIVQECFFKRKYFIRQLIQSLPKVIMIFSQSSANAFISSFTGAFTEGNPAPKEPIEKLLERKIVLKLGTLPNGEVASARIVFAPHITGDPKKFKASKQKIIDQLVDEGRSKNIQLNVKTGHLVRPPGSCTLCPSMEIGKCDYEKEIVSLKTRESLYGAATTLHLLQEDKRHQHKMVQDLSQRKYVSSDWNEAKE
jgi:hypothetical protein